MIKWIFTLCLIALLAISWLLQEDNQGNSDAPRIIRDMTIQQRVEAQSADSASPHGMGARQVPPKTMAWLMGQEHSKRPSIFGEPSTDYARAGTSYFMTGRLSGVDGDELPQEMGGFAQLQGIEKRGKATYEAHCASCHGVTGNGKGSISIYEGMPSITPFSDPTKYDRYPLGKIFRSIIYGQANMPAFGNRFPAWDAWACAVWVQTLRKPSTKNP